MAAGGVSSAVTLHAVMACKPVRESEKGLSFANSREAAGLSATWETEWTAAGNLRSSKLEWQRQTHLRVANKM